MCRQVSRESGAQPVADPPRRWPLPGRLACPREIALSNRRVPPRGFAASAATVAAVPRIRSAAELGVLARSSMRPMTFRINWVRFDCSRAKGTNSGRTIVTCGPMSRRPSYVQRTDCRQAGVLSRHGWRPYWSRWTTVPTGLRGLRPYRPLGQPSVTMQHGWTVRGSRRIRRATVFDHSGNVIRVPPKPIDLAASRRFWALG
jgi:hypothetical protein